MSKRKTKEELCDIREVNQARIDQDVNDQRVHTDQQKWKAPTTPTQPVNDPVENCQQQAAPAGRVEDIRTCPDVLDNRKLKSPEPACCHQQQPGAHKPQHFATD